jgi:hypothetical protein
LAHCYNNPSLGYNNVSDTNDLPIDATTNHPRKKGLQQYQEQRRHSSQVSLSPLEVRQTEWVEGDWPPGSSRALSVLHPEPMPLPRQDNPPLKKHNGRTPRIRYVDSCNRPSPHILPVSEGQRSGNPDPIPRVCIYSHRQRYPESLPAQCTASHCHCPVHSQIAPLLPHLDYRCPCQSVQPMFLQLGLARRRR